MPIVRGRPGTTSALVQLPQAVKRLRSLRLSNTLVAKASMFHLAKSRPANRSTNVAERSLPWKMFGLHRFRPRLLGTVAPAAAQTAAVSAGVPTNCVAIRSDDGAEPW